MFKKIFKSIGIVLLALILISIVSTSCSNRKREKELEQRKIEESTQTYDWPSSDFANLLPKPESKYGEVEDDTDSYICIDIYGTKKEFKAYVKACKDKGFVVDHDASSDSYEAKDSAGNKLSVDYDKETTYSAERYSIQLEAPKTEQDSQDTTTEITESTSNSTNSSSTDFKAAMDSYEQFFNKYVDFMKSYNDQGKPDSMLGEYTSLMAQYVNTMSEMSEISEGELSNEDLEYYIQVHGRIMQKLAEIQ